LLAGVGNLEGMCELLYIDIRKMKQNVVRWTLREGTNSVIAQDSIKKYLCNFANNILDAGL